MRAEELRTVPQLFFQQDHRQLFEGTPVVQNSRLEYTIEEPMRRLQQPRIPMPFRPQMGRIGNELPENYICNRCKQGGHHIKNCPRNGDDLFAPHHARGVPKAEQHKNYGFNSK
jgi:hypothetical protein